MKNLTLILSILVLCLSCTNSHYTLDTHPVQEAQESIYGTSSLTLIRDRNNREMTSGTAYSVGIDDGETFTVWPYPNTDAPILVESSDSTIVSVLMTGHNTFCVDCGNPGRAVISVSSEDQTRLYNMDVYRYLLCDIVYDPTYDRMSLKLMRNEGSPMEEEFFQVMEFPIHIVVKWTYKVGYGSAYMNTYNEITEIVQCTAKATEETVIGPLASTYSRIKEAYEEELEYQKSLDPKHDWAGWSGIECEVSLHLPLKNLTLTKKTTEDSVSEYDLGFTFRYIIR